VREICERYGLPYNVGPLHRQFGSVVKKIGRLALPDSPRSLARGLGGTVGRAGSKLLSLGKRSVLALK
jgi:hypothetical protein